jgi:hypothetical protein
MLLIQDRYISIISDDDLITENYLIQLLKGYDYAKRCYTPRVIICFQTPIIWSPNHHNSVSFRGLVKKNIPDYLLYLDENQYNDMMADNIWIL